MVFSVGEKVYAKGHKVNMWYSATVTQVTDADTFNVVFDDGSVSENLRPHEISSEGRFRRGRSRSRSRSRGRSKSPSRKAKQSPSPSRSPSRKVKTTSSSPSRKSSKVEDSPPKKSSSSTRKSKVVEEIKEVSSSRKSKVVEEIKEVKSTSNTPVLRQSARIAEKISRQQENGEGEVIEIRRTTTTVTSSTSTTSKKVYAHGGPWATFFEMLFMPLFIMGLIWICTEKSCNAKDFLSLHKIIPRKLSAYYDCNAVMIYLGFLAGQYVLALLPVGPVVEGQSIKAGSFFNYRCNGFFAAILSLLNVGAMSYFKCGLPVAYTKFQQLAFTGLVVSFLFSVALYLKAWKNPNNDAGSTGCVSHDFYLGRELYPRIGPVDVKMFLGCRVASIGLMCLNVVLLAQSMEKSSQLNKTLLLSVVLQTFYILDLLVFEQTYKSSMYARKEGCGFMIVMASMLVPFIYSLPNKYLLEHPEKWSYPWMGFFLVLFLIGYVIKRGSDSQKANFRQNPHDPSLANLESMPTTGGKRLLVSGWWGLVRHPNYLGEIIMTVAWTLPCGTVSCVPYIPALLTVLYLCVRAKEDGVWCRQKHGAPWEKYCERVKYNIIPYVY